jgi:hypothetical protein
MGDQVKILRVVVLRENRRDVEPRPVIAERDLMNGEGGFRWHGGLLHRIDSMS